MANSIPKLTKRAVDALKASGADTVHRDGALTGFGVRVRKSGRKDHVLQTRVAGKLLGPTQVQTTARHAHLARDSIQTAAARITGSIGENLSTDRDAGKTAQQQ